MSASTKTVTLTVTKEHSVADRDDGANTGNAGDNHAPIGFYNGWTWRDLIRAPMSDFGGSSAYPGGGRLVSVDLRVKTTSAVHVNRGANPRIQMARLTADFTASGGGENHWGTTYGSVWPGPGVAALYDLGPHADADNTVVVFDATDPFEPYLPAYLQRRDGSPGAEVPNNGWRLMSYDEGSTSRVTEFYSIRGAYAPHFTATLLVGKKPPAPTLTGPSGVRSTAPTTFTGTTTETPVSQYDVQVSTSSSFGSFLWNASALTAGISGGTVNATYAGSAQPVNVPLYWRMRTANDLGVYGDWSAALSYSIFTAGAATVVFPVANGLARISNLTEEAEWTDTGLHAKAEVTVRYDDPALKVATRLDIKVYSDVPTLLHTQTLSGAWASGTQYDIATDWTLQRGIFYRVEAIFYVGGVAQTSSGLVRFKCQWGQGIYTTAPGATATGHRLVYALSGTDARVAFLHRFRGGTTGAWKATTSAAAPIQTNWDVLVRLSTRSAQPLLASVQTYWTVATAKPVDQWVITGLTATLDDTFRRFGVKSLHLTTTASTTGSVEARPDPVLLGVLVSGGTQYTASVYVNTRGVHLNRRLRPVVYDGTTGELIWDPGYGDPIASTDYTGAYREGWQRIYTTFTMPEGTTRAYLRIYAGGGPVDEVWLDAVQMEEGGFARPWSPGLLGPGVILDKGGIAIDASKGGIFRAKGSSGGVRDVVELGASGLVFGGEGTVTSPTAGALRVTPAIDVPSVGASGTVPANPPAGYWRLFADTDSLWALNSAGTKYDLGYEEGTWTPSLTFATPGSSSIVLSVAEGRYQRVGTFVTCSYEIRTSTFTPGTASGTLRVTGMPYTHNMGNYLGGEVLNMTGWTKAGSIPIARIMAGGTGFEVYWIGSGAALISSVPADFPSGGSLIIHGMHQYQTSQAWL